MEEGVELGEGLAALGPQGVRRIQNPRNPLLLGEGREGDDGASAASCCQCWAMLAALIKRAMRSSRCKQTLVTNHRTSARFGWMSMIAYWK